MIIEAMLEQSIIDALQEELWNADVQIVGSRLGTKIEDADKKTIVAVASGFRAHDAFSLTLINVPVAISIATRVEGDAQSQEHNATVEKIVDLLVGWHKDGQAMSDALTSWKFLAGELRMDGGTTQTFDRERMIWTDIVNITIRGAERFFPEEAFTYVQYNPQSGLDDWEGVIEGDLTSSSIPNLSSVYDVEIGTEVTTIKDSAFASCSSLGNVEIPSSVTRIEFGAFQNCSSLTDVEVPSSVTYIGNSVFKNCTSLESIDIQGATSIGSMIFENCSSLTDVTLHEGLQTIKQIAFGNCSSLRNIEIPASVQTIEYATFRNTHLDSVMFKGKTLYEVQQMANYPWGISNTSIIHAELDYPTHVEYRTGNSWESNVVGVLSQTSIPNRENAEKVKVGTQVTSIGTTAFHNCAYLKEVEMSDGVTSIGSGAFYGCAQLSSVVIGDNVTYIGDTAFQNCGSLTSLDIPSSVNAISFGAFHSCVSLANVLFKGKTLAQVRAMSNYPWGISDTSIIHAELE